MESLLHRASLLKADGRKLWLFARDPLRFSEGLAPSPLAEASVAAPHMRYHPLEGEWVIYAAHRQNRPLTTEAAPDAVVNPLAPSADPSRPTELPEGNWEVAVFENRFPSLTPGASPPNVAPGAIVAPACGKCEVVVFGHAATVSLGRLGDDRVALKIGRAHV